LSIISYVLSKLIGTRNEREVKRLFEYVYRINELEKNYINLSDDALKSCTINFKERFANGEDLINILPEAFAVVRETSKRVLNERHYDVQLLGAIALHEGKVVEMKTGEGKTLTSTCPVYLNAITGKGAHVVTVNDYLAKRDSEWMGAIYRYHNLSVGCIHHDISEETRKNAYLSDITYGTNNEFGFDYLRDNMKYDINDLVQRDLNFAIVDEVDSILIDEARTPLIISGPTNDDISKYYVIDAIIPGLKKDKDFVIDEKSRSASLTDDGVKRVEVLLKIQNLYDPVNIEILHYVNQALKAHAVFKRDVDYVVQSGKVLIVDEFTGRLLPGRRFSEGLHQALEAKEKVTVERENQTLATITFQNYFRMYKTLSGMTGTAETEAPEFSKIYKLDVLVVPTNRSMVRKDLSDQVYKNEKAKFKAVVEDIRDRNKIGQPVLVGTISIEKSEKLSKMLKSMGIKHNVLNAKYHEKEAEIIANAGQYSAVTISTNMAGRGTDIKLGQGIADLGGLHVLGTERHESRRIDNQLRGRSGRQGDNGSSRFYLSLEDELMRIFGSEKIQSLMDTLRMKDDEVIEHRWVNKAIENAQKRVEGHNFDIRKHLLEYDDVMNQQREVIYSMRKSMLKGENLKSFFLDIVKEEVFYIAEPFKKNQQLEEAAFNEIVKQVESEFDIKITYNEVKEAKEDFEVYLYNKVSNYFEEKISKIPEGVYIDVARMIFLQTIDSLWKEHLKHLDYLKEGIGLRGYAQVNPLLEYKKEAFNMFVSLDYNIKQSALTKIFKVQISNDYVEAEEQRKKLEEYKKQDEAKNLVMSRSFNQVKQEAQPITNVNKVGRNDLCPCGSGKKHKKCCGK